MIEVLLLLSPLAPYIPPTLTSSHQNSSIYKYQQERL